MNLYLVKRGDDVEYDETVAYVCAAVDENGARGLGKVVPGDQPDSIWFAPTTSVGLIGTSVVPEVGVILTDEFH